MASWINWLNAQTLTHLQFRVLTNLLWHMNADSVAFPSTERLAGRIKGTSEYSISRTLRQLAARGLIRLLEGPERQEALRRAKASETTRANVWRIGWTPGQTHAAPQHDPEPVYAAPAEGDVATPSDPHMARGSEPVADPHTMCADPHMVLADPHIMCADPHIMCADPHIMWGDLSKKTPVIHPEKKEGSLRSPRARARARVSGSDPREEERQQVVEAWNLMARDTGLSPIRGLTKDRIARLNQRLAEHGIGGVIEAVGRIGRSRFCHGGGERGWHADFDFLLQPQSLTRTLEGRYDDRAGAPVDKRQITDAIAAFREARLQREASRRLAA
jgi:hypothetical protein